MKKKFKTKVSAVALESIEGNEEYMHICEQNTKWNGTVEGAIAAVAFLFNSVLSTEDLNFEAKTELCRYFKDIVYACDETDNEALRALRLVLRDVA